MKLARFTEGGSTRIGVVLGEEIVDLAGAAPELPREMVPFLEAGSSGLEKAREAAERGGSRELAHRVFFPSPEPGKGLGLLSAAG